VKKLSKAAKSNTTNNTNITNNTHSPPGRYQKRQQRQRQETQTLNIRKINTNSEAVCIWMTVDLDYQNPLCSWRSITLALIFDFRDMVPISFYSFSWVFSLDFISSRSPRTRSRSICLSCIISQSVSIRGLGSGTGSWDCVVFEVIRCVRMSSKSKPSLTRNALYFTMNSLSFSYHTSG